MKRGILLLIVIWGFFIDVSGLEAQQRRKQTRPRQTTNQPQQQITAPGPSKPEQQGEKNVASGKETQETKPRTRVIVKQSHKVIWAGTRKGQEPLRDIDLPLVEICKRLLAAAELTPLDPTAKGYDSTLYITLIGAEVRTRIVKAGRRMIQTYSENEIRVSGNITLEFANNRARKTFEAGWGGLYPEDAREGIFKEVLFYDDSLVSTLVDTIGQVWGMERVNSPKFEKELKMLKEEFGR